MSETQIYSEIQWVNANISHCCLLLGRLCTMLNSGRGVLRTPNPEPEKSAPGRSVTWLITSLGPCLSLTSLHLSERGSKHGSSSKPSSWFLMCCTSRLFRYSVSFALSSVFSFSPFYYSSWINLLLIHNIYSSSGNFFPKFQTHVSNCPELKAPLWDVCDDQIRWWKNKRDLGDQFIPALHLLYVQLFFSIDHTISGTKPTTGSWASGPQRWYLHRGSCFQRQTSINISASTWILEISSQLWSMCPELQNDSCLPLSSYHSHFQTFT